MDGKIVEIIGCAGVGKSSAVKCLSEKDPRLQNHIDPTEYTKCCYKCVMKKFPILLLLRLLGIRRHYLKTLVRIQASLNALQTQRKKHLSDKTLILDQGPLAKLAYLYTKGAPTRIVNSWLQALQEQATQVFDLIIWLDAPNSILRSRLNQRNNRHQIKNNPKDIVDKFYDDYRIGFTKALNCKNNELCVYHIHTAEIPIRKVAEQINRYLKESS